MFALAGRSELFSPGTTVRAHLRPPYDRKRVRSVVTKSVFSAFLLHRPKIKDVTETLGDRIRYGYVALPLWVFAEQLGAVA